jgi:hypothetical protein
MADLYFNRYYNFLVNGQQSVVPFVSIPKKTTDKQFFYKTNISRLDKVSQEFYNSPYFGWLILAANPIYGGLEWSIPDNALLSIPYPLVNSIQDYEAELNTYLYYYAR